MNEIERGLLAAEVMSNEAYLNAYDLIEREIIATWRDARDFESRERLHLMLKLLSKVRQALESAMQSGKIESKALETRERSRLGRMFKGD
jgi:hypothetical protein